MDKLRPHERVVTSGTREWECPDCHIVFDFTPAHPGSGYSDNKKIQLVYDHKCHNEHDHNLRER